MLSLDPHPAQPPIFTAEFVQDHAILTVAADATVHDYRLMQREYNRLVELIREAGTRSIIFDLSQCNLLDSLTIGLLISVSNSVRQRDGGSAVLCSVSLRNFTILSRLMLIMPHHEKALWRCYDDRESALQGIARVTPLAARPAG